MTSSASHEGSSVTDVVPPSCLQHPGPLCVRASQCYARRLLQACLLSRSLQPCSSASFPMVVVFLDVSRITATNGSSDVWSCRSHPFVSCWNGRGITFVWNKLSEIIASGWSWKEVSWSGILDLLFCQQLLWVLMELGSQECSMSPKER